jgi:hypothetical protein
MKHKHHIIPKHMGGSDEEDNLIELTIEEHAEAHRKLYEEHGRWEDYLAWQGLAGLMTKEELVKEMLSEAGRKGALHNHKRKGKKFGKGAGGNKTPVGTGGTKWYHNPENPSEKKCFREDQIVPEGWVRGQGKKAKNPGVNFHAKRTSDGPQIGSTGGLGRMELSGASSVNARNQQLQT